MPVLGTKLHAPTPRRQLVPRPRLIEQLRGDSGAAPRLVLVAAPAGFGKTTALAQWLISGSTGGPLSPRVAWLSLDPGDSDLRTFLTHLIAALRTARPAVGDEALTVLDTDRSDVATAVLISVINELDSMGEPMVIALDDYHVIDTPAVHDALTFLLDHLPARITIALTSRSDPPLPLARLRARGELLEVRAADLRFTPLEADALLNQVMELDLDPSQVAALEARTEGWATGLQLAGLSARSRAGDPAAVSSFVQAFAGSNRFVLDYLLEEVLRSQPEDVRAFLLDTSILPQLTGPLCDALTGRGDGQHVLETLEHSNLFVLPLDDHRQWFRYHHLFAEALRSQLTAKHPARVRELHRAAVHWHVDRGELSDAIPHALAAAEADHAAELVELALPGLRRRRQDHLLREWLQALPEDTVRRRPLLATFLAWSRLSEGDLDGVETWLDIAQAAASPTVVLAEPTPVRLRAAARDRDDELRMVPALIEVYRASVAQARNDTVGAADHAGRALALVGPDDHFTRGAAAGFLGLAAWAGGDLSTAIDTFSDAVASLTAAGNVTDALGATVVLAGMWRARGRPDEAQRLYRRALEAADRRPGPALPVSGDLHVGYADVLREHGDLAAAEQHLQIAEDLGDAASLSENRYRRFVVTAGLARARGDLDAAISALERAESLHLPGYFPDTEPIPAVRARVRIAQGALGDAWDWARAQQVTNVDGLTYLTEFNQLTLARLVVARCRTDRDTDGLDATVELLDRVVASARAADRGGSVLDALIVRALAHATRGQREAALDDLGDALGVAEQGGHVRAFLDEGPAMLDLLRAASARPGRVGAARASALLGTASAEPVARRAPDAVLIDDEVLSDRELAVLRMLATELTGPEIARHLFVSVNTLRTHTRHIFTKLGVNTRAAAVRRGHELGLL
ncbi:MAG TPA: LuxR C-terminal-related transcriptional regulator [Microlunatus sp.]